MIKSLTKEEMAKYRKMLFDLGEITSLKDYIKNGLKSGIPIEYFIQSGTIKKDNYKLFSFLEEHYSKIEEIMESEITLTEKDEQRENIEDDTDIFSSESYGEDGGEDESNESVERIERGRAEEKTEYEKTEYDEIKEKVYVNEMDYVSRKEFNNVVDELEKKIVGLTEVIEELNDKEKAWRNELEEKIKTIESMIAIGNKGETKNKRKRPIILSSYANKGGVGKTTVAVSMAEIIAEKGHKTLIIDFDYGGDSLRTFFKIEEQSKNYIKDLNKIDKYIIQITDNLFVLPSSKEISSKSVRGRDIDKLFNKLGNEFDVIVCDTCTAPYEREYMHSVIAKSDRVYAVVNQGIFSREETKDYAPRMLYMGATPDKVRIILNQYEEGLADIAQVEKDFNHGLTKVKREDLPKVTVVIPNEWRESNLAMEEGIITNKDIWEKLYEDIVNYLM